jgi:hypothetical protein
VTRRSLPLLLLALHGAPVLAQGPREPWLPVDHWSRSALQRLAAGGAVSLIEGARAWPLRRDEVRRALETATSRDDDWARLAREYRRAFDLEFPAPAGPGLVIGAGSGFAGTRGQLLGGTSTRDAGGAWQYPGPRPEPQSNGVALQLTAEAALGPILTMAVTSESRDHGSAREAWLSAGLGPLDLWAGRRGLSFGETGGAFVLSSDVAFDGAGLRTARASTLPAPFAFLGPVDATLLLSRFSRSGQVESPWFAASRIAFSPATWLAIGLNRAALFGGEGNVQATSLRNLLFVVGGLTSQAGKDSGYENQVASIDVRVRLRAAGLPVLLRGEVAIDDVGFTMFRTAAFSAALEAPALPGLSALGLALEHTRIPESCCTQPPWYRHGDLGDGWTRMGHLLGHPLGGHGSEWQLSAAWSGPGLGIRGSAAARVRGKENLLAPDHGGSSLGGSLMATVPLTGGVVISGATAVERGADGWRAWQARIGVQFRLRVAGRDTSRPARKPDPTDGSATEMPSHELDHDDAAVRPRRPPAMEPGRHRSGSGPHGRPLPLAGLHPPEASD